MWNNKQEGQLWFYPSSVTRNPGCHICPLPPSPPRRVWQQASSTDARPDLIEPFTVNRTRCFTKGGKVWRHWLYASLSARGWLLAVTGVLQEPWVAPAHFVFHSTSNTAFGRKCPFVSRTRGSPHTVVIDSEVQCVLNTKVGRQNRLSPRAAVSSAPERGFRSRLCCCRVRHHINTPLCLHIDNL